MKNKTKDQSHMNDRHDCMAHLQNRTYAWSEPHGERHTELWHECRHCGEKFTSAELVREYSRREQEEAA
jgi:hypothetical protein